MVVVMVVMVRFLRHNNSRRCWSSAFSVRLLYAARFAAAATFPAAAVQNRRQQNQQNDVDGNDPPPLVKKVCDVVHWASNTHAAVNVVLLVVTADDAEARVVIAVTLCVSEFIVN